MNGFTVEVKVTPANEASPLAISSSEQPSSNVSKHRSFVVSKSEAAEEQREIMCVAMVADEIDAHGDLFTPAAVKFAADNFLIGYNVTKDVGINHSGELPDIDLIGSWATINGGTFDELVAPPNSWVVKFKVNDDAVWAGVKAGDYTGVSIEGKVWSEAPASVAKSVTASSVDSEESSEAENPKRVFVRADPRKIDLVNAGANLQILIYKAKDISNMADKIPNPAPTPAPAVGETIVTEAAKGANVTHPAVVPEVPKPAATQPAEVEKGHFSASRKAAFKTQLKALQALANELDIDLTDEPAAEVQKALGDALASALAPIATQLMEVSKRLAEVENARGVSNAAEVPEQEQPEVKKSLFSGVFGQIG
jgi:hypothetical protein